jgi:hypothetical protein
MDGYAFGYLIGRYSTRALIYTCKATMAIKGYRSVAMIANVHKIDITDPQAVTDNVFSCLEYVDW